MRFRFGLILAAAASAVTGACAASSGGGSTAAPAPSVPGGAVLAQGERPRENDFTEEAERELGLAAIAATPEAGRPHYEAALQQTQAAIAEDPTNPLPWLQAGTAYIGLADYQRADSALDRAETLRPIYELETETLREQAWIELYNQAIPSINSGDYAAVIPYFENANTIYDKRPEVMITLGQVYASLGEVDKAVENLRNAQALIESDRAMEMDSATVASWQEQGAELPLIIAQAYMQGDRYQEASTVLSEILAEDPDNFVVSRTLATVYAEMDRDDDARRIIGELLARPGLAAEDVFQAGIGYYQMEDYLAAADAFQRSATMAPKNREAIEFWARSLQYYFQDQESSGAAPDAAGLAELQQASEQWAALDPNNQNSYIILAQTVNKAGDEARARELIQQIENLPVWVEQLDMRRNPDGGATLMGEVRNKKMQPGQSVTLRFTFFGESGQTLGTQTATVTLPPVDATQVFDIEVQSTEYVAGYSYAPVG
jgi:tetratricopeptide (TPR) repeat protein